MCYRNSVLIMLLCSDRFMNWVQNCHIARIQGNDTDQAVHEDYTDILMELEAFWDRYWSDEDYLQARRSMKVFWDTSFTGKSVISEWQHEGQMDAPEFLDWIRNRFVEQLRAAGLTGQIEAFETMLYVSWTSRNTCSVCPTAKDTKFRSNTGDVSAEDRITVPLTRYIEGLSTSGGPDPELGVELQDVLESMRKDTNEGWRCEVCYEKSKVKSSSPKDLDKTKSETDGNRDATGFVWKFLRQLPEVLIMQVRRYIPKGSQWSKENAHLRLPEEIDRSFMLDHAPGVVPDFYLENTRYRLVGVVLHAGNKLTGHYINYVRDHAGSWWVIDGEDVEKMQDFGQVNVIRYYGALKREIKRKAASSRDKGEPFTPYLLCWEKIVGDPGSLPAGNDITCPSTPTKVAASKTSTPLAAHGAKLFLGSHSPPRPVRPLTAPERAYNQATAESLADPDKEQMVNIIKANGSDVDGDGAFDLEGSTDALQAALYDFARRHDPNGTSGQLKGQFSIDNVAVPFELAIPRTGDFLFRSQCTNDARIKFSVELDATLITGDPDSVSHDIGAALRHGFISLNQPKNVKQHNTKSEIQKESAGSEDAPLDTGDATPLGFSKSPVPPVTEPEPKDKPTKRPIKRPTRLTQPPNDSEPELAADQPTEPIGQPTKTGKRTVKPNNSKNGIKPPTKPASKSNKGNAKKGGVSKDANSDDDDSPRKTGA